MKELTTKQHTRSRIMQLEAAMVAMPEHQVAIETKHRFAPGVYMREIFVPKGVALVGKIQKTEYLNVISKGVISVMTEDGLKKVSAPCVIRSNPGLKRAGVAHEDTIWVTVHQNPTNERDIEKLEDMLFAESFEELPAPYEFKDEEPIITWQGKTAENYLSSQRSIQNVLEFTGTSAEEMKRVSEDESDQIEFPYPVMLEIKPSPIHGSGTFALSQFKAGDFIAPARVGSKRTPAGRYCNHSPDPNAKMVVGKTGDVLLVATKSIESGDEITTDYYMTFLNQKRGA